MPREEEREQPALAENLERRLERIRIRREAGQDVADERCPTGLIGPREGPADGRLALQPATTRYPHLPLRGMVLPHPQRDRDRLHVERLPQARAMAQLLAVPRLLGWRSRRDLQHQFALLADLVRRVPVYEAQIPWGPPFDMRLGRELVEAAYTLGAQRRGIVRRVILPGANLHDRDLAPADHCRPPPLRPLRLGFVGKDWRRKGLPFLLRLAEALEEELAYTRQHLQAAVQEHEASNEELKASNEEIRSINEELQASNEELETAKEELQSLNEELNTVNNQLQAKVSELENRTDELNNLLNGTDVATLFLDRHLCIRWFTPAMKALLEQEPHPTDDYIRHYLSGNLCRCATYVRIREAIHAAARDLEGPR